MTNQKVRLARIGTSLLERKGWPGQVAGWVIDLALLAVLAFILVKLFWIVLSPTAFLSTDHGDLASKQGSIQSQSLELSGDPSVFSRFNPFNRNIAQSEEVVTEDAPETSLNLKIRTLLVSSADDQSFVRIETPDSAVKRFVEGDTILSGVTLSRILSDRIVLMRNGQREVLYMREGSVLDLVKNSTSAETANQTQTADALEPAVTIQLAGFDEFYNGIQLRRMATDDGATALFVQEGSRPDILAQADIKVGDQLVSVNQYDLREGSLSDLFQNLKSEREFVFVIKRGGQTITRTLVIG